jgi:hypothetical protein
MLFRKDPKETKREEVRQQNKAAEEKRKQDAIRRRLKLLQYEVEILTRRYTD